MFDALLPIVLGTRDFGDGDASWEIWWSLPKALMQLDARRAKKTMKSGECLRPDNIGALSILFTLHDERENLSRAFGVALDPPVLWRLFDAAYKGEARTLPDRADDLMGLVLTFTADLDPTRTWREARQLIHSLGKEWAQGADFAQEALRRCKSIPEPEAALARLHRNPMSFSKPATDVLRAYELATHIVTDGLMLYYYTCGDQLASAAAGLKLLKLKRASEMLAKGSNMLVPKVKNPSLKQLRAAYDRLSDTDYQPFVSLVDRADGQTDLIRSRVKRYISAHPALFR